MIRADGDGLVAAQIDIAGRTAGVIPVRALCTVADIVLDLHRAGKSQNAVAIANIATHIYAAASSRIVAGDAAAGHGEGAAAANMHAAAVVACAVAADRSAGHGEGAVAANMHTAAAAAACGAAPDAFMDVPEGSYYEKAVDRANHRRHR